MKVSCTLICLFLFVHFSNATIRRVGFTDVPAVPNVDYTSFYLAHQAAVNGDTIYVYPGKTISQNGWPTNTGRAEITKRLVIVGRGNWLDSTSSPKGNGGYQATKGTATFGGYDGASGHGIYFLSGSAGSVLMGFDGQGQYVLPQANNITIKSNYNLIIWLSNFNISNLTIEKNYRVWFDGSDNNDFVFSNFNIRNNFIYQFLLPAHSYNGVISNNTFAYDNSGAANGGATVMSYVYTPVATGTFRSQSQLNLQNGTWLFENNLIVYYAGASAAESPFTFLNASTATLNYNVAVQSTNITAWPGQGIGNVFISPSLVPNLFEAFPAIGTSSADTRYRLKAGSAAKAGSASRPGSTVDAGMFDVNNPYKIATIPSIPTIYKISSPDGNSPTGNTLQINISTRSNN